MHMTSSDWSAVFSGIAALFTFGGVSAWWVARKEHAEARAERKLTAAARESAEHVRLTPRLSVQLFPHGLKSTDQGAASGLIIEATFGGLGTRLIVRHLSDSPVRVIDELRIRMRNDTEFRAAGRVWGPWKLQHGADGADVDGWTAKPRTGLLRGDSTLWAMEKTANPDMVGGPTRLRLVAISSGRAWEYPIEITVGETVSPAAGGPLAAVDELEAPGSPEVLQGPRSGSCGQPTSSSQ